MRRGGWSASASSRTSEGERPACKHWQTLLTVIDKLSPAIDDSRAGVEQLMAEHDCAASAPGGE